LVGESGPDHSKYFEVAAEVNGKRFTSAWGRSKKDAEQRAAANALAELRSEEPPFPNTNFQQPTQRIQDQE
jgi:ribonuclease-3